MENQNNQKPPKTWLIESILITIFCCGILGIPAILHASKVESRFYSGDIEAANEASRKAKKWVMGLFWTGLILIPLYFIFIIVLSAAGSF